MSNIHFENNDVIKVSHEWVYQIRSGLRFSSLISVTWSYFVGFACNLCIERYKHCSNGVISSEQKTPKWCEFFSLKYILHIYILTIDSLPSFNLFLWPKCECKIFYLPTLFIVYTMLYAAWNLHFVLELLWQPLLCFAAYIL